MMEVKKTTKEDVEACVTIYQQAQQYFKDQGVAQWQWGYPDKETVLHDIEDGRGYVVKEDGEVVGVFYVTEEIEETYLQLDEGAWPNDEPYISIHRTAVRFDKKGQGIGSLFFEKAEEIAQEMGIRNLRVDTHPDNHSMQRLILKNGFEACGKTHIPSEENGLRIVYQKILK